MTEEKPKLKITKSPDFKMIYTTGVFGGLTPKEARIIFFVDRIVPDTVEEEFGKLKVGEIERELQVEIHMSPQEFLSVSAWMQHHIERMKKEGLLTLKEEKASEK